MSLLLVDLPLLLLAAMFAFSSCSSSDLSNSPWLVLSVDWAFARLLVVTSLGGGSSGVVIFGLSEGGDDFGFVAGAGADFFSGAGEGFFSGVGAGFVFDEPAFADVVPLELVPVV
jgi:hypothetical protein